MERIFLCSLLLSFLSLFGTSCEKLELPEPTTEKPSDDKTDPPSGETDPPDETKNALSVAQLDEVPDGTDVTVAGYIVGYIRGNTIKNLVFGSAEAVASNVVIADRTDAAVATECAPLQLPAGSNVRNGLNLSDHPENLHRFVLVTGKKDTYFRTAGIKPARTFRFAEAGAAPAAASASFLR